MGTLKIHCGKCGQSWEIYERENWRKKENGECPHCGCQIDLQTWTREIVPAFASVNDANRELFKDQSGYHSPLFQFDTIAEPLSVVRSKI